MHRVRRVPGAYTEVSSDSQVPASITAPPFTATTLPLAIGARQKRPRPWIGLSRTSVSGASQVNGCGMEGLLVLLFRIWVLMEPLQAWAAERPAMPDIGVGFSDRCMVAGRT